MTRYRQDRVTHELIEIQPGHSSRGSLLIVKGVNEPFRSPVDGSVISTTSDLNRHNERNNVVNAAEFTSEFYESKAQERKDAVTGKKACRERNRSIALAVEASGESPYKTFQQYVDGQQGS